MSYLQDIRDVEGSDCVLDIHASNIYLTEILQIRINELHEEKLVPLAQETNVDILICGGIGGGAQTALAAAGIKLFGGVSGDADEAVNALINETLDYNPEVKCSHHEHNHEEGHACGEHGCGSHSCH